jgi:Cu+-exporting ATPase
MGLGSGYFDSLTGLVFFLLLGKLFQRRTYEALRFDRDYTSFFPLSVQKITEDGEYATLVRELKQGDRIRIRHGELIPTDAILLSGQGAIDNSFATGESEPVRKKVGDRVFAGGRQKGGAIDLEVLKPIDQSRLTQLWNDPSYQKDEGEHFHNLTDRISKHFTLVILLIATVSGLYWWREDPTQVWKVISAVLIVACPCALALSAPFAMGNILRIYGRNKLYLKNADVVENLAHCNHVILDKTGTLTESREGQMLFSGVLDAETRIALRSLTYHSGHPVSRAIYRSLGKGEKHEPLNFSEVEGQGIEAYVNGHLYRLGKASFVCANREEHREGTALGKDGEYLGTFTVKSVFRGGLATMAAGVRKQDCEISVLSGDNERDKEA